MDSSEREKISEELKTNVLSKMDPLAKTQLYDFVKSLQQACIKSSTINEDQKNFMEEVLRTFKSVSKDDAIDREVLQTLDRFDHESHFVLKSYLNKKPDNAVELADVLLQAKQLKTGFAQLTNADVEFFTNQFVKKNFCY